MSDENGAGHTAMEFEEFAPKWAEWYAAGVPTACFVGIRTDESLNRWRTIGKEHNSFFDPYAHEKVRWTSWKGDVVFNAYPIYDWRTEDIWRYYGKMNLPYNKIYDLMHRAGVSIHEQRICQPYGDDQRKGLWLWSILEPETWAKVVGRVAGANQGALYAQERGSVLGRFLVTKPAGMTWEGYARALLVSMPKKSRDQYEDKIAVFKNWWESRGWPVIPDEADQKEEAAKKVPSWRRIVKMLLKNDYWAKTLSFGPTKSEAFEKYRKLMAKRRAKWGPI
jgi:predicted phosphoadenosine phosphosulfate sulfurtransferase